MKQKNYHLLLLIGLLTSILAINAVKTFASEDAAITIRMSGEAVAVDIVDISNAPTTWDIKPANLNSAYSKAFELTNTGNVRVDTTIVGTDAVGSGYQWALEDSIGTNQYLIEYNIEGQAGTVNILETPVDFVQDLQTSQSKEFLLRIKTPTDGDTPGEGESIQATVTIHAVKG